jgi:DNA invertase Pin-like site-specific DNA recombinase
LVRTCMQYACQINNELSTTRPFVVVTKLDRIARSSRDLHNIIGELHERGCGFVSLGGT